MSTGSRTERTHIRCGTAHFGKADDDGDDDEGYCPVPPDLAAEVSSPTDEERTIADTLAEYERARVPLVWWIEPRYRRVRVHRLGKPVEMLTEGDVLDGEDVIPGFRLVVSDIYGA
ncbi:MAG: hypothetical protein QOF73_3283 [Thermomicrobiales bacterium]|nr:hypothetical protein [Thermomicrobiales bacterium]